MFVVFLANPSLHPALELVFLLTLSNEMNEIQSIRRTGSCTPHMHAYVLHSSRGRGIHAGELSRYRLYCGSLQLHNLLRATFTKCFELRMIAFQASRILKLLVTVDQVFKKSGVNGCWNGQLGCKRPNVPN